MSPRGRLAAPKHTAETAHILAFSKLLKQEKALLKILSSLRWEREFEERFKAQAGRPKKTSTHFVYPSARSEADITAFARRHDRLRAINDKLVTGVSAPVAGIFRAILRDIEHSDILMRELGREKFGEVSNGLYGRLHHPGGAEAQVLRTAKKFSQTLVSLGDEAIEALQPKVVSAEALAQILRERLREAHLIKDVEIRLVDELTADAAAGTDYVKLKRSAKFSLRDADVLLYHEIFTHVVTSVNRQAQPIAKWLAFDTPRCTSAQEGLAVFVEIYAGKTYPRRLRKIADRILCLEMIAKGEHCGHIYDWLRERGYSHRDTMNLIIRAFRGLAPGASDPFTKDLTYLTGLLEIFHFLKANLNHSRHDRIEMLFAGKLALDDIPVLCALQESGLVERPRWVPPQFRNLDALVTWFSCIFAFGAIDELGLHEPEFNPRGT